MAAPEGYNALGKIGISYKGEYASNTAYERLDAVAHNGSTYLAIKDAPDGAPRDDKLNWIYLAKGFSGDIGDSEIAFTEAENRENINAGESVKTVFGKIKKFFADLTAPAFAQMITSKDDLLATKATGYVPDAKAVADAVTDVTGKLPEYIDITAKCPASTWCNIPLPDAILSTNRVIDVNRPADSDSNVYGVIWWPSADKQITILRINTNGTNLTIDNTAKTIKLRIWFC